MNKRGYWIGVVTLFLLATILVVAMRGVEPAMAFATVVYLDRTAAGNKSRGLVDPDSFEH